ncbi:hypothetical protein B0H11DRAFT_1938428 [Mycena galericulata]|nr:hypothetical protein B0H11DRAFT_1938428 [Mycena galericulata]
MGMRARGRKERRTRCGYVFGSIWHQPHHGFVSSKDSGITLVPVLHKHPFLHGQVRSANPTAEIEMPKSQFAKYTPHLSSYIYRLMYRPKAHNGAREANTSLIFAGLFSAVISAFITQIQPELQPDPNATTEALLLLLVKNVTGITPPAAQQAEPATIIVAAQGLLYLSLFCTLFSALLATLGKQWLLYYSSAGERGTIEDRGLHYAFASNTHLFRP